MTIDEETIMATWQSMYDDQAEATKMLRTEKARLSREIESLAENLILGYSASMPRDAIHGLERIRELATDIAEL